MFLHSGTTRPVNVLTRHHAGSAKNGEVEREGEHKPIKPAPGLFPSPAGVGESFLGVTAKRAINYPFNYVRAVTYYLSEKRALQNQQNNNNKVGAINVIHIERQCWRGIRAILTTNMIHAGCNYLMVIHNSNLAPYIDNRYRWRRFCN
ncbi:hypothetical protein [Citrobacter freundii]|uniref:hypothetical protein n=1 Tax=Citrobacter freundii TaxID=546 RepID=UPI001F29A291|nr:hypothetical protein [Citrobacter freundii]